MVRLYNTRTRSLEDFVPITTNKVLFYHCGPTVYWTQHIGNLRGMTMGDILVRTFRYLGYDVTHVRNYTDVGHLTSDADSGEDKMEKGAKREGKSPKQIADKYISIFEKDTQAIRLLPPTHTPRATEYIQEMIRIIEELLKNGYAYETDLAVYFDVKKFDRYTELSRQKLDDLAVGGGKADVTDPNKKNPSDFALWFFKTGVHANALQFWPSPFHSNAVDNGYGIPGWHIECSAMCRALLGKTIDIHMGGVEHIPVHHTNEIAQSEAANGVPFVHYWLHNEHLVVDQAKMAKSAGTGMSLDEVIAHGFDPLALRYFYLQAQYRTRQNFTWDALTSAQNSLNQLRQLTAKTKLSDRTQLSDEKMQKIDGFRDRFREALETDLNMPLALSVAWETVKSNIPSEDKYDLLMDFDRVLGLDLASSEVTSRVVDTKDIPQEILDVLQQRTLAKQAKNFSLSDSLRKEIESRGYTIEDSPTGTTVKKKSS